MSKIEQEQKASWSERLMLINSIIRELNPLLDIRVASSNGISQPQVLYSTDSVLITIPDYSGQITSLENRATSLESRVTALENP